MNQPKSTLEEFRQTIESLRKEVQEKEEQIRLQTGIIQRYEKIDQSWEKIHACDQNLLSSRGQSIFLTLGTDNQPILRS